jgi:mono/diheme cytochrome c family protein
MGGYLARFVLAVGCDDEEPTMKRIVLRLVGALAASALVAAPGCGADEEAPPRNPKLEGPVPKVMRSVRSDAQMIDRGKALFAQCAGCHGPEGHGVVGLGPRLNSASFLAAASDDFLVRTITKGRAGTTMIPWAQVMGDYDIYSVVAYMRSWHPVKPVPLDESPLDGDEARGGQIFAGVCSACHGRSGAGYQETANGTGIGRAAFMREVSNGYLRYIIKNGKDRTKMKGFREDSRVAVANLTPQQIDDVITYLRLNAW